MALATDAAKTALTDPFTSMKEEPMSDADFADSLMEIMKTWVTSGTVSTTGTATGVMAGSGTAPVTSIGTIA